LIDHQNQKSFERINFQKGNQWTFHNFPILLAACGGGGNKSSQTTEFNVDGFPSDYVEPIANFNKAISVDEFSRSMEAE